MSRRRTRTAVLIAGLTAVLTAWLSGCGSEAAGGAARPTSSSPAAAPAGVGDRAELLATCPAQAPSWYDLEHPAPAPGESEEVALRRADGLRSDEEYLRDLHARYDRDLAADPSVAEGNDTWSRFDSWGFLMTHDEEMSIWRRQEDVGPALAIADRYLRSLPKDQSGGVRNDAQHGRVVVSVTRGADAVRQELQALVGDLAVVDVETVRYSHAELTRIARQIEELDGIHQTSIGADDGNGRVEITVQDDLEGARALIEAIADPCAFTLTIGSVSGF